jgi:hypothetical protein
MATTNETIANIVDGPDKLLYRKALGAVVKIARGILAEDPLTTVGYEVRRAWALRTLRDPSSVMRRVRVELSQNAGIRDKYETDDHTDLQVGNVIEAALWKIISEGLS